MARLTDNNGALLGSLETLSSRSLPSLGEARNRRAAVARAVAPPRPPEYGPGEIVFALHCDCGALATLAYSPGGSLAPRRPACDALVEEPEERHYCPACGGYYCARHAQSAAHDCRAALRAK